MSFGTTDRSEPAGRTGASAFFLFMTAKRANDRKIDRKKIGASSMDMGAKRRPDPS